MGLVGVSFRIAHDEKYEVRWMAVNRAVEKIGPVWNETSSMLIVRTDLEPSQVADKLRLALDIAKDKAIVFPVYHHTIKRVGVFPLPTP